MKRYIKSVYNYVGRWFEDGYVEKPNGFDAKSYTDYNADDWAYYLADELGLNEVDYLELVDNIKNIPANEWIDDWRDALSNLDRKRGLPEFMKFIHYSEN